MGEAVRRVRAALDEYRFNEVAAELYSFTWDELCSWYLELTKATFKGDDASPEAEAARQGTCATLYCVFHGLLRLLHRLTPFIT